MIKTLFGFAAVLIVAAVLAALHFGVTFHLGATLHLAAAVHFLAAAMHLPIVMLVAGGGRRHSGAVQGQSHGGSGQSRTRNNLGFHRLSPSMSSNRSAIDAFKAKAPISRRPTWTAIFFYTFAI
jgi:hypothetical protein